MRLIYNALRDTLITACRFLIDDMDLVNDELFYKSTDYYFMKGLNGEVLLRYPSLNETINLTELPTEKLLDIYELLTKFFREEA